MASSTQSDAQVALDTDVEDSPLFGSAFNRQFGPYDMSDADRTHCQAVFAQEFPVLDSILKSAHQS